MSESAPSFRNQLPTLNRWRQTRLLIRGTFVLFLLLLVMWGLKRSADRYGPLQRRPMTWTRFTDGPVLWVQSEDIPPRPIRLLGLADTDAQPWQNWMRTHAGPTVQIVLDDRFQQPRSVPWALVYLEDGRLLNEELIRAGLAGPHPDQRHDLEAWFNQMNRQSRR